MEPWAKTLTAIVGALRAQGLSRVDELRRPIEDLAPQDYDRPYFERWAEALCDLLEEQGFTSRAEIEPRAVLKEFGTELADHVTVRVHDSNADMRYLVLPMRPAGTEGWSEEALAQIVTRDCMVGVTVPRVPAQARTVE
jgi:hypothetical protein